MHFSEAFGLNHSQAALDFVDIDPDHDFPLYFDPYVFENEGDPFSVECNHAIVSFFSRVLHYVRQGDEHRGVALLNRLSEPNEICLGVSRGKPSGRGIGEGQAGEIYFQLAESAAAQSGLLSDLAKCELFVKGIGPDKISDICANIIRNLLVGYTQSQCELHGIDDLGEHPVGATWNINELRWEETYHRVPIVGKKPVVLVPKKFVRWKGDLSHQHKKFYDHFVLNFLQNQHLASGTALVTVLVNGDRKVYKTDLKAQDEYKLSKDFLFRFSNDNPVVLQRYVEAYRNTKPPTNYSLEEDFNENAFVDALKEELVAIAPGTKDAPKYEKLMAYILEYIFYPNLVYPKLQAQIHGGRKRLDILYTNSAKSGFFNGFLASITSHQYIL